MYLVVFEMTYVFYVWVYIDEKC